MEVQAIVKRWSQRYDERLLDQLIYMPEVTPANFDLVDWLRGWVQDLNQRLNALGRRYPYLSHRAARRGRQARRRVIVHKTEHARRATSTCRGNSSSPPNTSASRIWAHPGRADRAGAYVTRGSDRQESRLLQGSDEVAVRPGTQGSDHPAL